MYGRLHSHQVSLRDTPCFQGANGLWQLLSCCDIFRASPRSEEESVSVIVTLSLEEESSETLAAVFISGHEISSWVNVSPSLLTEDQTVCLCLSLSLFSFSFFSSLSLCVADLYISLHCLCLCSLWKSKRGWCAHRDEEGTGCGGGGELQPPPNLI